jgi:luciferase-like monooxygenase
MSVRGAQHRIREAVSEWHQVTEAPHRFGGVEFRLGRRELGHIHGDWLVDIPFPKQVRDEVISTGEAEPHHILPESGWVSIFLRQDEDVERAIHLLGRSFSLAVGRRGRSAGVPVRSGGGMAE